MDGFSGYEFAAGSVHGIRRWRVDTFGRLVAVSHERVWKPGENVASCLASRGLSFTMSLAAIDDPSLKGHQAPQPHCGCGYWAYLGGNATYGDGGIVGVVEGYGRTIIGDKGFRCEKARVVALAVHESNAAPTPDAPAPDWREGPLGFVAIGVVAALVCALGIINGPVQLGSYWWALPMVGGPLLGVVGLVFRRYWVDGRERRRQVLRYALQPAKSSQVSADLIAKVRRNYPDVKIYPTKAEMLAAHPVDSAPEPNPDTPEFWSRPVVL